MTTPDITELHARTSIVRFAANVGERDQLYQRSRRGEVVRVHKGCYVDEQFWRDLGADSRHRYMAHLAAATFGDHRVFSHRTAATLWRLPALGAPPSRVHVAGPPSSGSRRSATLMRHALGGETTFEMIDGLRVTPLEITVAQLAATESFSSGVVFADAALRRTTHPKFGLTSSVTSADITSAAADITLNHGGARARSVAEFADGRADRPGESVSRVSIRAAGLTMPQLQVELFGASGLRYIVDFYWPELRLIGEFDGKAKYSDPEFLRGRTPQQALSDEKAREDDLRAANNAFSRWGWNVALSPTLLAVQLRRAGVR